MPLLYSKGIEYALRCLQLLAQNPSLPRTVVELCDEAKLPEHFTRKMLQPLVRTGLLKSHRGPGGGFVFSVPPEQITLRQVIAGIEGKPRKIDSLLNGHAPPQINQKWTEICHLAEQLLDETTIADLNRGWTGIDEEFKRSQVSQ